MARSKLTDRQFAILCWVADGCPEQSWPDQSHKITAHALQNRGLAVVSRKRKVWAATIIEAGQYYLEHGTYKPRPLLEPENFADTPALGAARRFGSVSDVPALDATARAMRRVATRRTPTKVARTKREIKETYMRYKVVVTRVQAAERFVRAKRTLPPRCSKSSSDPTATSARGRPRAPRSM